MVYMYHSFLIYLSADGHLGCFHVLAMINSAVVNIGVHVSLSDLVSPVCMPFHYFLLLESKFKEKVYRLLTYNGTQFYGTDTRAKGIETGKKESQVRDQILVSIHL